MLQWLFKVGGKKHQCQSDDKSSTSEHPSAHGSSGLDLSLDESECPSLPEETKPFEHTGDTISRFTDGDSSQVYVHSVKDVTLDRDHDSSYHLLIDERKFDHLSTRSLTRTPSLETNASSLSEILSKGKFSEDDGISLGVPAQENDTFESFSDSEAEEDLYHSMSQDRETDGLSHSLLSKECQLGDEMSTTIGSKKADDTSDYDIVAPKVSAEVTNDLKFQVSDTQQLPNSVKLTVDDSPSPDVGKKENSANKELNNFENTSIEMRLEVGDNSKALALGVSRREMTNGNEGNQVMESSLSLFPKDEMGLDKDVKVNRNLESVRPKVKEKLSGETVKVADRLAMNSTGSFTEDYGPNVPKVTEGAETNNDSVREISKISSNAKQGLENSTSRTKDKQGSKSSEILPKPSEKDQSTAREFDSSPSPASSSSEIEDSNIKPEVNLEDEIENMFKVEKKKRPRKRTTKKTTPLTHPDETRPSRVSESPLELEKKQFSLNLCQNPYPCCCHTSCLFNHRGRICTIFGKQYIFCERGGVPLLICLDAETSTREEFCHCRLFWRGKIPFVLSTLEDGTEVMFDAVLMPGTNAYVALMVWHTLKPDSITLLMEGTLVFLEERTGFHVQLVDYIENKMGFIKATIDGCEKTVLFSSDVVFLNGRKARNEDDVMLLFQFPTSEIYVKVSVFLCVGPPDIFVYIPVCIWNGATPNYMLYQHPYFQGKLYKLSEVGLMPQVLDFFSTLYCDVPCVLSLADFSAELSSEKKFILKCILENETKSLSVTSDKLYCKDHQVSLDSSVDSLSVEVNAHIVSRRLEDSKGTSEILLVQIPEEFVIGMDDATGQVISLSNSTKVPGDTIECDKLSCLTSSPSLVTSHTASAVSVTSHNAVSSSSFSSAALLSRQNIAFSYGLTADALIPSHTKTAAASKLTTAIEQSRDSYTSWPFDHFSSPHSGISSLFPNSDSGSRTHTPSEIIPGNLDGQNGAPSLVANERPPSNVYLGATDFISSVGGSYQSSIPKSHTPNNAGFSQPGALPSSELHGASLVKMPLNSLERNATPSSHSSSASGSVPTFQSPLEMEIPLPTFSKIKSSLSQASSTYFSPAICSPIPDTSSDATLSGNIVSSTKQSDVGKVNPKPDVKTSKESTGVYQFGKAPQQPWSLGIPVPLSSKVNSFDSLPGSNPDLQAGSGAKGDRKIASPLSYNHPTTSKPSLALSHNQPTTSKPSSALGHNQPATSKPSSALGHNQPTTSKPSSTLNQPTTSKPSSALSHNQPTTSKPSLANDKESISSNVSSFSQVLKQNLAKLPNTSVNANPPNPSQKPSSLQKAENSKVEGKNAKKVLYTATCKIIKITKKSGILSAATNVMNLGKEKVFFLAKDVYVNGISLTGGNLSSFGQRIEPFKNSEWYCLLEPCRPTMQSNVTVNFTAPVIWLGIMPPTKFRELKKKYTDVDFDSIKVPQGKIETKSKSAPNVQASGPSPSTSNSHITQARLFPSLPQLPVPPSSEVVLNKGIVTGLANTLGKLKPVSGGSTELTFLRHTCYLYGIQIRESLCDILPIGLQVLYEENKGYIKKVYLEGSKSDSSNLDPQTCYKLLSSWCDKYSVEMKARDRLLVCVGWLPPELNPTAPSEEVGKTMVDLKK